MVKLADMNRKPGRPRKTEGKRPRNVDRHATPRKAFHASEELFAQLQAYIDATQPAPSESGCLRLALEEFLAKRGFWPKPQDAQPHA